LKTIYRQKEIFKIKSVEIEADLEEVAASCGHFSFSLLEFGEQLKEYSSSPKSDPVEGRGTG
jgi:hypothetical protein